MHRPSVTTDLSASSSTPCRARRRLLQWPWLLPLCSLVSLVAPGTPRAQGAPPLMLARPWHAGADLAQYWVSEKYDGLRAFWDGHRLFTRGGEVIHAPPWFTRGRPAQAMDGELWAGYRRFEQALSTVRRQSPVAAQWRQMRFMVFDLPRQRGAFDQRLPQLQRLVRAIGQDWVQAVPQRRVGSRQALQRWLEEVEARGGEGLMLHRGASAYRAGRSDDLLKLKSRADAEATVIGHLPGKGKYRGMLGALLVQTPEGVRFAIGSGLTDAQRRTPPALGSVVSYRYSGVHPSGKPRFAVLWRARVD